jgi:general stress protein 26
MAEHETTKDLAELVEPGTIVMLMTMIGGDHSSRPLTVAGVDHGTLEVLVDRTADWAEAIDEPDTVVHVSVADVRSNVYLSLNGTASITPERAAIERLWNPGAAAFFDGKEDPAVAVLRFAVSGGEYWDAPSGRIGSAIAMVKAAVSDDASAAGDHGTVTTG